MTSVSWLSRLWQPERRLSLIIRVVLFEKQTVKELAKVLEQAMNKTFDYTAIAESAQQFSVPSFRKNLQEYINACLKERA